MNSILDRQTFVISVNMFNLSGVLDPSILSQVSLPMNLRFAANELRVKSIAYHVLHDTNDVEDIIQIWCNQTNDGLIATFPNSINFQVQHDEHFRLNNSFQTGNFTLQFQSTDLGNPASFNPQSLISSQNPQRTFGTVSITVEFVKLAK